MENSINLFSLTNYSSSYSDQSGWLQEYFAMWLPAIEILLLYMSFEGSLGQYDLFFFNSFWDSTETKMEV